MQEIRRWQPMIRSGQFTGRWTNWARSLAERHGRISFRHGALDMRVVEPLAQLYLLCQRWQSYAWKLCPQIKLSIAPILRETIWQGSPVLQPSQAHYPVEANHKRGAAADSNGENPARLIAALAPSFPAPLRQVLHRLNEIESVARWHRQTLLVEESRQILQRVVQQRQRVEEKMQRPTIVRQQPQNLAFAEAEREVMETQSRTRAHPPAWPQAASSPAINLEQLTDQVVRQIDRRLVAYRERMGKPF